MNSYDKLQNEVMFFLSQNPEFLTAEQIRQVIKWKAQPPFFAEPITDEIIDTIARRIESLYGLFMDDGTLIEGDEPFDIWYPDFKASPDFNPYFWGRYRDLLVKKQFAPAVITAIDSVTEKIVGQLENPTKDGHWDRRGMIVGHVQSGKTANFIGVVNKAADAGYKLIIVLAGMLESLRSQTQERVDEGFVGEDSSKKNSTNLSEKLIGVGNINPQRFPLTMTDLHNDFRSSQNFQVRNYETATVLVVKKNTSVLRRLSDWLLRNNSDMRGNISELPLLMIDDEADHASINTNDEDKNPTAINTRIRQILNLFNRKCYLAYTATPFANIFIDPDSQDDMLKDDLFPRDFIISLDPPSNYVGSERIFNNEGNSDIDIVRNITDIEDILPLKHRKDYTVPELPKSLRQAVCSHIISKAIRILRGQNSRHHSMLIHVSRYKDVQKSVHSLVFQFKQDLENNIRYNYKYSLEQALSNQYIHDLFALWESDFKSSHSDWHSIQQKLLESIASMQVLLINGDSDDSLNYKDYRDGMNVIAVGGDRLARGLTLEGLATSYFYRSTSMYDTLMQMGRWFGYRDGFADICRIYLTPMTENYFMHISEAVEELRDELKEMFAVNLTPKDFGLKVRTHPGALLITAKNKMRASDSIIHRTDLSGRLIETYVIDIQPGHRSDNFRLFTEMASALQAWQKAETNNEDNYVWSHIRAEKIADFLEKFHNHPHAQMTQKQPVLSYLNKASEFFPEWDIVFVNTKNAKDKTTVADSLEIGIQKRSCDTDQQYSKDNYIEISSRRRVAAGTSTVERAGMSDTELNEAMSMWKNADAAKIAQYKHEEDLEKAAQLMAKEYKPGNIPGRYLRRARKRPLLMLHLVNSYKDINNEATLIEKNLPAYGISFPKRADIVIEPVEYAVNTTYVKNLYQGEEDDEE